MQVVLKISKILLFYILPSLGTYVCVSTADQQLLCLLLQSLKKRKLQVRLNLYF